MRDSPLYKGPPYMQTLGEGAIPSGMRKFVIVLPADQPSHDLCKTIGSAVALGYPAPIIVNWKQEFHTDMDGIGPSQLGKISGTLGFLDWVTSEKAAEQDRLTDDDIVLMLDAYDVWLQLPPSVLIDRYFRSNARANERIKRDHHLRDNDLMHQSIIVSAQKGCVAPRDSMTNLHCADVPESTLPPNVYGPLTDYQALGWKYVRPRYVNSGSFMGPTGDMRRYFRRVKDKMDRFLSDLGPGQELAGDQGVFAEVFGEQEIWRQHVEQELRQQRHGKKNEKTIASLREGFEYHVGLDYTQELFYPTCYSESDGYFVSLNDTVALLTESKRLGVSPPRIKEVPDDIAHAEIPGLRPSGTPSSTWSWGHQPLYTDFWTTTIPVALHHNAWRHGLKNRRVTWWDKMWYFPHLRNLLEASTHGNAPLATFATKNASLEVWGYGYGNTRNQPTVFTTNASSNGWMLRATNWDSVCRDSNDTREAESHWYDEVFRDGRGSLED